MGVDERVSKALKSALTHLENSALALNKGNENLLTDNVWRVAAELEYALFLFSIMLQDEVDKSGWKINPKLKKVEVGPTLVTVRDLLTQAEKFAAEEKLLNAYKNTYIARNLILKVQEIFTKRNVKPSKGNRAIPQRFFSP
jgi:hypothetical protein